MPNAIAYLALVAWPIIAIYLFNRHKSQNLERVIIWLVVWSFLYLPQRTAIDLPVIPPLDKVVIPNLVLIALLFLLKDGKLKLMPETGLGKFLILGMIFSPFVTALLNSDAFWIGAKFLQGISLYDAFTDLIRALVFIIPFVIGRCYLGSALAHREFLHALVIAGLVYTIPILFENRFSPQLHTWVYGFFQHSFAQHVRGGFFRPIVFMVHGLWVAFFIMTALAAAAILWRRTTSDRIIHRGPRFYFFGMLWLAVALMLCHSAGAIIFGILLIPMILFLTPRLQIWIASAMVVVAITYPALRGADVIPTQWLLEKAGSISDQRAKSLGDRFRNEDLLLARANERPLIGWGGWGRGAIWDPETAERTSVADGFWVVIISTRGWIGYLVYFGILCVPVLMVLRHMIRAGPAAIDPVVAGLCLMHGVNMLELLPNATLPPWSWLVAGALMGYAENARRQAKIEQPENIRQELTKRPRTVL
jgi:hypothetical protein